MRIQLNQLPAQSAVHGMQQHARSDNARRLITEKWIRNAGITDFLSDKTARIRQRNSLIAGSVYRTSVERATIRPLHWK